MLIQTTPLSLPQRAATAGNQAGVPSGFLNELVESQLMARYATLVKGGRVYSAYATLTAPVAFSTAAGVGGPLLWNKPSSLIDAHILAVGFSTSVVSTVAGGLGLTGGVGQTVTPSATTPIDASGNMLIGGNVTQLGGVFRVGTVTNAGAQFLPLAQLHTGALTVDNTACTWQFLDGIQIITPGTWGAIAATAALLTLQIQVGLLWAELPN